MNSQIGFALKRKSDGTWDVTMYKMNYSNCSSYESEMFPVFSDYMWKAAEKFLSSPEFEGAKNTKFDVKK